MQLSSLLVPLDGSELAAAALPLARLLATANHAEVTLVMVAPSGAQPGSTREMHDYLAELISVGREAGITMHASVRVGNPAEAILERAREIQPDLIVMATHGRSGIGRTLLGSVTDHVLRACATPLLVLRPGERQVEALRKILVPVDGTPGGALALTVAAPLSRQSNAPLVLVRAFARDADGQAAEGYIAELVRRLRGISLEAEGGVVGTAAGEAIVTAADQLDVDLIVMSTHSRWGAARTLLGSVADEVVRNSRRPVLLVHRGVHLPHAGGFYELLPDVFDEPVSGLLPE
jgi:nucleotide-binding universal stress UspA family protein